MPEMSLSLLHNFLKDMFENCLILSHPPNMIFMSKAVSYFCLMQDEKR